MVAHRVGLPPAERSLTHGRALFCCRACYRTQRRTGATIIEALLAARNCWNPMP